MKFLIYLSNRFILLCYKGNADVVISKSLVLVSMMLSNIAIFFCGAIYFFLVNKNIVGFSKNSCFGIIVIIFGSIYFLLHKTYSKNYFKTIKNYSEHFHLSTTMIAVYFVLIYFTSALIFWGGLLYVQNLWLK